MVEELFNKNIFMYIMLGLCVCGVLLKAVLNIVFLRLMKASDNMGTAKNKLTQMMKKKFETCYKLKIGVNNVDIFVDKYVYRHKFCGFLITTWENICGQILMLCLLIGSISAVLGLIYEVGKQEILSTFSVGILTSGVLIFLEGLMNFAGKKELIRLNMKDYLENFFKVRLEQELTNPGSIEQYKKELLMQEEGGLIMINPALVAATSAQSLSKSDLRAEKRIAKKQEKKEVRLNRERKKNEDIASRERAKVEKRLELEMKKEEIQQKKLDARMEEARIRNEEKQALEEKKEAERAELLQKKAEARAEVDFKRKEKHRQEEIKRALLLEKQAIKEEKQKQTVDHKTIAQEKKDSLKREVQERRTMEGLKIDQPTKIQVAEELKTTDAFINVKNANVKVNETVNARVKDNSNPRVNETVILRANETINVRANETVNVRANETVNVRANDTVRVRVNETANTRTNENDNFNVKQNAKIQDKPIHKKKLKQSDPSEEKLIEDILKEFLA